MAVGLGACAFGCSAERIPGAGSFVCADDGGLSADAGLAASGSLVSGTFTSPDISATVCRGGAFAQLNGSSLQIGNASSGVPAARFLVQRPADAVYADLWVSIEIDPQNPGRYESAAACGNATFDVALPVPSSVDCQATPPAGMQCPPGCVLEGPILGPSCMPVMPELAYEEFSPATCGYKYASQGSFTLTVTSIATPDPPGGGSPVVHGALSAELSSGTGPGATLGSLSLSF